jgi:para-aminobenzoate synthetase component 1
MIIEDLRCSVKPYELCQAIVSRGEDGVVFLDSAAGSRRLARRSFIFAKPFLKLVCGTGRNGFAALGKIVSEYSSSYDGSAIPAGAAAGYVSYDAGLSPEGISSRAVDDIRWPGFEFGFYDAYIVYDHQYGKYSIVSTGLPEKTAARRMERAKRRLEEFEKIFESPLDVQAGAPWNSGKAVTLHEKHPQSAVPRLRSRAGVPCEPPQETIGFLPGIRSNFTKSGYVRAVNRIKKYIEAGDVYQVNLSQRFTSSGAVPNDASRAYGLYLAVRRRNAVPYGAFTRFGERSALSFSMERFLKMRGGSIETRPIKGTLPRGRTPREDEANAKKLFASAKDRAELLMITDLERNDLGRTCDYGSVAVKNLCEIERYATVFHLVSTVSGRLGADRRHVDCFRECFPGGSITGAPKIRSMEIIDELERVRRGLYCGSIGYFGFNRVSDFNIAIRTMMITRSGLSFGAGGGITYDSDPEQEYDETLHKVRTFFEVLQV